jgi:hypothetical protein
MNMNPTFQHSFNSKTLFTALSISALLAISSLSCKKSTATGDTVSIDDAANAITEAVSPESSGMVAQTETAVVIVNTSTLPCGTESDTAFSGQNPSGTTVTYSYAYNSSRMLTCDNGVPQKFEFDFSGKTSYDAPRISSSDSARGQFSITGLQPSASQYVFDETYTRNGSESSKIGNKNSFTSTIAFQSSNITVDKTTQQILSGTATVTIIGATTNGKSFSYSGTITFLGNKQATLVLGSGNTYSISWS